MCWPGRRAASCRNGFPSQASFQRLDRGPGDVIFGSKLVSADLTLTARFKLGEIAELFGLIIRQVMRLGLIVRRFSAWLGGHIARVRFVAGNACRVHGLLLDVTGTHEHA